MSSANNVVDLCSSDSDSDSSSGSSWNRGRARLQTRRAAAEQRVQADTASDSDGGSTDASTDCSPKAGPSLGVLPQKRKLSRLSSNLHSKPQGSRTTSRGSSQDKRRSSNQLGLQAVGQGPALRELAPVLASAGAGSKRSDRTPAQTSMREMGASKSATRVSQQSSSAWTTDDSDGLDFFMGDLLGSRKRRRISPGPAGQIAAHGDPNSKKLKIPGKKSAESTLKQASIARSISGTGLARGGANARASSRPPSGRPSGSQGGALVPPRKSQINVDDPWDISFCPVTLEQLCLHKSRVSSVGAFLSQPAWKSATVSRVAPSARGATSTDTLAPGEFPSLAVRDSPIRRQAQPLSEQPGTVGKESGGSPSSGSPVPIESKGVTCADEVDDDDLLALAEAMEEADKEDLLALAEAMEAEEQGTGGTQPPRSLTHRQPLQGSAGLHPGHRGNGSMAISGGFVSRPRCSRLPRPSTRLLVLFGPPGTGKSTAVKVAAEQAGLEVSTWEDSGSSGGYSRSLLGGMAGDQGSMSRDGKVSVTEDFCGTVRAACAYRSLSLHGLDSEPVPVDATAGSSGDISGQRSSSSSSSGGVATASMQAQPVALHQEAPSARVLLIEDLPPAVHKSLRWGSAPSSGGRARSLDGVGEDTLEQVRSAMRLAARRARCPVVLVLSSLGEDCERPTRRGVEQLLGPGLRDAPGVRILESPPVPDTRMRAALRRVVACARGASLQLQMGSGKKNAKSCPARRYLTDSDDHAIEMAIASAGGDLRHAIAAIQMAERRVGGAGRGSHRPPAGLSLTSKGRRRVRDIFDDSAGGRGGKPEPSSGYASSSGAESAGRSGSDREGQSRKERSSSSSSGAWCERDDFLDGLHSIGKLLRGRRLDAGEGNQGANPRGKGTGQGSLLQPSASGPHASSAAVVMREATKGRMDGLPAQYLSGFADHPAANAARAALEFSPDSVAQSSVLQGGTLLAFLQDGAPSHFASIEELAASFEVYADADAVFHRSGGGGSRQGSRASRATAVDGGSSYLGHNLGHSLVSRAAAAHCVQRASVGFQPIRRPQSLSCAAVARRNAEWASARLAGLSADFDAASLAGPVDRPVEFARADSTGDRPTAPDLASQPGHDQGRPKHWAGGTAVCVLSNRGVSFQERASVLVRKEGSLRRGKRSAASAAAATSGLDRAVAASVLRPRATALLRALAAPLAGDEPRGGQAEDPVALVVDRIDMSGSRVDWPAMGDAAGTNETEHAGRVSRGGEQLLGPTLGGVDDDLEDIDEF